MEEPKASPIAPLPDELVVFPWTDNFETGIIEVDSQHRRLVDLINELATLTTRDTDKEDINRILSELTHYTDYHFSCEEKVWAEYLTADASYAEHQLTHQMFLEKVTALKGRVTPDTGREVLEDVLQFLISWLLYHILDTDKQMAVTIHAIQAGMSFDAAKAHALKEVSNSKILTNTIISMYNMLTIRSLHLLNEREEIRKLKEKVEANERREKSFSDTLFNSIPGLLYILDADLNFLRFNNAFSMLLGYSAEDLATPSFLDLFPSEEHARIRTAFAAADDYGSTQFESAVLRKDASRMPFILTAHAIHYGERGLYAGVGIDNTRQKQTEDELLRSQSLFEEAQQIAKLGHWTLTHSTSELMWSDEIFRIFEKDKGTFTPSYENFLSVVHPEDRAEVNNAFIKSVATHKPYEVTHRLLLPGNRIKYVKEMGSTVYSDDGSPILTIGNVQDVTKDILAEQQLQQTSAELKDALMSTIAGVAKALEARDPYTAGHQQRVAEISVKIAEKLELDEFRIEGIDLGARIHDLGKIAVPAELLTKPVRLSKGEYMVIQGHAEEGYKILKDIHFPWPIQEIILQHHERLDGSGYPHGLKGDEITLEAKIVAVADVFEAMSTNRPYRESPGVELALQELNDHSGTYYDSAVVDALTSLVSEGAIQTKKGS